MWMVLPGMSQKLQDPLGLTETPSGADPTLLEAPEALPHGLHSSGIAKSSRLLGAENQESPVLLPDPMTSPRTLGPAQVSRSSDVPLA